MKIEKAIEILKNFRTGAKVYSNQEYYDAHELGIEALKRELHRRKYDIHLPIELLPGETKE